MRVLRMADLVDKTGLSKSKIYQLIKKDGFPAGFKLGERARGFLEDDVDCWLRNRSGN